MTVDDELMKRFWDKTEPEPNSGCILWLGGRSGAGYGRFQDRPAHVVAWEFAHGRKIPDGMEGCHTCDNPSCVNPAHVFAGTRADNVRDCLRKGRFVAWCSLKTHCPYGHAYVSTRRQRRCRTCRNRIQRLRRRVLAAARRLDPQTLALAVKG